MSASTSTYKQTFIKDTTGSTDKDSGALVVEGGVGIEENLNVGGNFGLTGTFSLTNATNATDKDTGALVLTDGGLAVEQDIFIGGNFSSTDGMIVTGGTGAADNLTLRSTTNGTKGSVLIDETTTSTSKDTGALVVEGGVGVEENLNVGGAMAVDSLDALTATTLVLGGSTATKLELADNGVITEIQGAATIIDSTASTSTSTGSLVVSGGVGIAGAVYMGTSLDIDNIRIDGNTFSSTNTDGAITFTPDGNGDINLTATGTGQVLLPVGYTPIDDESVVTKEYADALVSGLDVKNSCRAKTEATLDAYTQSGTGEGATLTATANGSINVSGVDGITDFVVGQRILVDDDGTVTGADRGIYEITQLGDGSNPWILTRATDADNSPAGEVTAGMYTFVTEGTVNANKGFLLTTNDPIVLDTTTLNFTQFSGTGTAIDHGALTGLADDDHTQYALLAGRSGGQALVGGIDASDVLTLESTSNGTKGTVQSLDPFETDDIDARTSTTLLIGKSTATKVEIADTGVITEVQGQLTAIANTASTSTGTGSLVVTGGAGISGNLHVGGTLDADTIDALTATALTIGGTTATSIEIGSSGIITDVNGQLTASVNTTSTSTTTGSVVVTGGVGISENLHVGGFIKTDTLDALTATTLTIGGDIATKLELGDTGVITEVQGQLTAISGTGTTSSTTGALVVTGGVGISENLFIAGDITGTASTVITGGEGASNNLTLRSTSNATKGSVIIDETTGSTDKDTGALVVEGGVGIEENLNVGGDITGTAGTTVSGGIASGDDLTLQSTTNATKGDVIIPDRLLMTNGTYLFGPTGMDAGRVSGTTTSVGASTTFVTITLDAAGLQYMTAKLFFTAYDASATHPNQMEHYIATVLITNTAAGNVTTTPIFEKCISSNFTITNGVGNDTWSIAWTGAASDIINGYVEYIINGPNTNPVTIAWT